MPLVLDKKKLYLGAIMLIFFLACIVVVFLPIFNGKTGMQAADDLFNSLSKGSSYYIPEVREEVSQYGEVALSLTLYIGGEEETGIYERLLKGAGAETQLDGDILTVRGNLGAITNAALNDADDFFNGREDQVSAKYSTVEARPIIYHWHKVFAQVKEHCTHEHMYQESLLANKVMTKALEPSYNFAGIASYKVSEKATLTACLLIFYLIYTLWYGFGVMFLFEGLGIVVSNGGNKET